LRRLESVAAAYDVRRLDDLRASSDPVDKAVFLSATADAPGDIFVVPARNFIVDPGMAIGRGTSHGSPWEYDQQVPLIAWGAGVRHARTREALDFRTTAATLASLLGVEPPRTARVRPLPGVGVPAR
jgi:hypothetical protein